MLAFRSATYALYARWVADKRDAYQTDILAWERRAASKGLTDQQSELLAFGRQMMEYLTRQQARYKRAARRPWLPAEPDPPPPQYRVQ